ncbi:ABC transporter integral membrane protein [Streptomyces zinciresistens K42]|uniref:ABC transporter integral membrane protein n=1 Tax=Streptomyces zinciresistens K42 TaxID=700597 RepID=G2GCQ1_9ACTN|nr:ABC transporter permease [Streptomyces zinciresistens]EGX58712.1 ABC transporter integral membrane protein [Streptomyces zinciresistens K42]
MTFGPAFHAECLKIRTLRSLPGTLLALFAATTAFSAVAGADQGTGPQADPLFSALSGVLPGQIAAITFGALAVSGEYRGGALRVTLLSMPRRGLWFAAKAAAVAGHVLLVGLVTAGAAFAAGRAGLGAAARAITAAEAARAVAGCGIYLTLMALFATGLTAVLRSGVAALSILVPFVLVVSFVVGDSAGTVADLLPDRAGQAVLRSAYDGVLGPWPGLAVTALWTAGALLAGAWCVRRRDA